jgi:hypothetical protein
MARYRPRKEIKTWFYRDIDDQARLIEYVDYLKTTRQLAKIVRNGIRLMWSLGEGDTSVLFELFPGLKAQLTPPQPPPPTHSPELDDLIRHLERMEAMMKESRVIPLFDDNGVVMKSGAKLPEATDRAQDAPRQLAGAQVKFSVPIVDDDDSAGVVVKKKAGGGIENFMTGLLGLGISMD